jgi:hypothetical protein
MEKNKKKNKFSSQNLTQQNEGITFSDINKLLPEMLTRIFSFLPIEGQLKIVTVCKLWNQLIHDYLAVSKSISLNGYTLEQSEDAVVFISKNCPKLQNISINFNDSDEETSESSSSGKLFLDLFCENDSYRQLGETHGNQLKQISINGCKMDCDQLKILMQKCSQLEVIRGDSYKFIDKETPHKELKEVQIIISSLNDLNHFESFTEAYNNQIISMSLKTEQKIYYFEGLIPIFQQISRFKSLKQLSFDSDFKLNEGNLSAFEKLMNIFKLNIEKLNYAQLESFEFDVDLINTQNTGIQILPVFAFNGLIHLKIWSKEVPKMQQESVSYLNCKKLESFSTNIPINISKIGQYLSNLTSINLQTDFIYTDSDLCSLANLIKLKSIKLSTDTMFSLVTDDGVNRLIDSCLNLNDIEFSFQPMINSRTLSALKSRAETVPFTDVKFICGNNKYGTKKVYSNLYVDHYDSLISQPWPFDDGEPFGFKELFRKLILRQYENPLGESSRQYENPLGESSRQYENPLGESSRQYENPLGESSRQYENPLGESSRQYENPLGESSRQYENPLGKLSKYLSDLKEEFGSEFFSDLKEEFGSEFFFQSRKTLYFQIFFRFTELLESRGFVDSRIREDFDKLGLCAQIVSQKVANIFKYLLTFKDQDLYLYIRHTISQCLTECNKEFKFKGRQVITLSQIMREALTIVETLAQLDKKINQIITCKLLNKDLINNQFIKSLAQVLGQVYWFIELKLYVMILSLVQLHTIPTLNHYICYTISVLVIS